jgi:AbrB family looped-hinge helix DNA binding protein
MPTADEIFKLIMKARASAEPGSSLKLAGIAKPYLNGRKFTKADEEEAIAKHLWEQDKKTKSPLGRKSMTMTTLSSKNQITLPADVREFLHAKAGDRIMINVEGMHAVLRAVPAGKNRDVSKLSGALAPFYKGPKVDVKAAIMKHVAERNAKTRTKKQ